MSAGSRFTLRFATLASSALIASTSWACPSCPLGRSAREQVLAHGFATNLAIALAPFVVVGIVCAWAERIGDARNGSSEQRHHDDAT
jgi:hypothetical protein